MSIKPTAQASGATGGAAGGLVTALAMLLEGSKAFMDAQFTDSRGNAV
jgi:hypothetical protein